MRGLGILSPVERRGRLDTTRLPLSGPSLPSSPRSCPRLGRKGAGQSETGLIRVALACQTVRRLLAGITTMGTAPAKQH